MLNGKVPSAALALDFSKAFDCVNRDILYYKLNQAGVRGLSLNWIKSYFDKRSQVVKVNNTLSSQKEINIGVAQGSILRPILFNIYINDLVDSSNDCKFFMFADDTNLIVEVKDCLHLEQNIKKNGSKYTTLCYTNINFFLA